MVVVETPPMVLGPMPPPLMPPSPRYVRTRMCCPPLCSITVFVKHGSHVPGLRLRACERATKRTGKEHAHPPTTEWSKLATTSRERGPGQQRSCSHGKKAHKRAVVFGGVAAQREQASARRAEAGLDLGTSDFMSKAMDGVGRKKKDEEDQRPDPDDNTPHVRMFAITPPRRLEPTLGVLSPTLRVPL